MLESGGIGEVETIEIIDRLMKVTGNWPKTFELLDKYPIVAVPAQIPEKVEPLKLEPQKQIEVISPSRKKFSLRAGSLKSQILEVLEQFPGSTVNEITSLAGRESEDHSSVSAKCKDLVDHKLLIRKKNDAGKYVYRLPASAHH